MPTAKNLLTADELAVALNVRPGTIRQWARNKLIPEIRITPKVLRYCYDDIVAVLRTRGLQENGGRA